MVCAYGGWDDAFTEALMEVVQDDSAYPEVIWTSYSPSPTLSDTLLERLAPGIDRGRITLYADIDCNTFFPELYEAWSSLEPRSAPPAPTQSNPVRITPALTEEILLRPASKVIVEGDDENCPPLIDIYAGRDQELKTITGSDNNVVFITGIGGQVKSTVAAKYYRECQSSSSRFSHFVWRDCKEEAERFEIQLASIIEGLSKGKMTGSDLAKQSTASIVEILMNLIGALEVLFVFDNVDHYIDIETRRMSGIADVFVTALLQSPSRSRAVFTCRPSIAYGSPDVLNIPLAGIHLEAAESLFAKRGAVSTPEEIKDADNLTEGHTL